MFGMFGSPEEIAAHQEQHRLSAEASRHDMHEWLDSLDRRGLEQVKSMLMPYLDNEEPSAAYFIGYCTSLMKFKFNICPGCGKNHDDLDPSVLLKDETGDTGNSQGPHVHLERTKPEGPAFERMSGEELLLHVPKAEQDMMDEYGLDFIEYQYPKVKCANCGTEYVSLDDRMMKPADKGGCSGCIQKEQWG